MDYEREPYILDAGDVRITFFDRNVRGAYPGRSFFDPGLVFRHVLEPKKLVMQVKFTEFLPRVVGELLPSRASEFSAVFQIYPALCSGALSAGKRG